MRISHRCNPLHRIEQWNGQYFRPGDLWEVGSYLLVHHHAGDPICPTLQRWCDMLESAEEIKDDNEQEILRQPMPMPMPVPMPDNQSWSNIDPYEMETCEGSVNEGDEEDEDDDDLFEGEEDVEVDDNPYLSTPSAGAGAGAGIDPSFASATLRSYVRVVHTNGLHNIAMVSCQCHGEDVFPLDLFAAQMIPASLKKIKTLFTAQVLDSFRLSNLELKASAYQFYQLLRRLTRPMAPAEVPNLYREFRRMTRIWRWMKKLKWAGYAGSNPVSAVKPGELAIYCPACPQPGINLPDNWKDDPAQYGQIIPLPI